MTTHSVSFSWNDLQYFSMPEIYLRYIISLNLHRTYFFLNKNDNNINYIIIIEANENQLNFLKFTSLLPNFKFLEYLFNIPKYSRTEYSRTDSYDSLQPYNKCALHTVNILNLRHFS